MKQKIPYPITFEEILESYFLSMAISEEHAESLLVPILMKGCDSSLFSTAVPETLFPRLSLLSEKDIRKYDKRVEFLMETPAFLTNLGFKGNSPVYMYRGKLALALFASEEGYMRHGHSGSVGIKEIQQTALMLSDPLFAYRSKTVGGSIKAIYPVLDKNGECITVIFRERRGKSGRVFTCICTLFGISEEKILRMTSERLLAYFDNTKRPDSLSSRLQERVYNACNYRKNVITKGDILNGKT